MAPDVEQPDNLTLAASGVRLCTGGGGLVGDDAAAEAIEEATGAWLIAGEPQSASRSLGRS